MILEIAVLNIQPGSKESFEKDFRIASQYISSIDGYIEHSLLRCMEVEHQYVLTVKWQKIEDHTIGFRSSEAYKEWKRLLHHYYDPFPSVHHYTEVNL